jgi:unsaturated rhamnogalacturonyl hydrolase
LSMVSSQLPRTQGWGSLGLPTVKGGPAPISNCAPQFTHIESSTMGPANRLVALCSRPFLLSLVLFVSWLSFAAQPNLKDWPTDASPQLVGDRVARRFVASVDMAKIYPYVYPAICAWYGALKFAAGRKDTELQRQLIERFDQQYTPQIVSLVHDPHVDHSMIGAVPLEIYLQTKQARYLDTGIEIADGQWRDPTPEGLTGETRFWIDDMYMITILQVQAFRATGDRKYLDRAGREMVAYLERLQRANGLFYHAPDTPFYWGRGNGWVAAGMAELLSVLPQKHPAHKRIMRSYKKMMSSLLKYQDHDGMWHQLVDQPQSWPETSASAMFTYAMILGVKHEWLPAKQYTPAVRKAWLALVTYVQPNGDLGNVCEGTGKKNDLQYYLDRKRLTGDLHGQAPMLWCAWALLQ